MYIYNFNTETELFIYSNYASIKHSIKHGYSTLYYSVIDIVWYVSVW